MAKIHLAIPYAVLNTNEMRQALGKSLSVQQMISEDQAAFTWSYECVLTAAQIMQPIQQRDMVIYQPVVASDLIDRMDLGIAKWWNRVDDNGSFKEYPFYDIQDDNMHLAAPHYFVHTSYRQKRPAGGRVPLCETMVSTPEFKLVKVTATQAIFVFENVVNALGTLDKLSHSLKWEGYQSPKDFVLAIP